MSNHQQPPKPPLSALDQWWNICDALSEALADDFSPLDDELTGTSPSLAQAISTKMELAHLARPNESPEEHIARLEQELAKFTLAEHAVEIEIYPEKIRQLRKAAGLPSTSARTSNKLPL